MKPVRDYGLIALAVAFLLAFGSAQAAAPLMKLARATKANTVFMRLF